MNSLFSQIVAYRSPRLAGDGVNGRKALKGFLWLLVLAGSVLSVCIWYASDMVASEYIGEEWGVKCPGLTGLMLHYYGCLLFFRFLALFTP
jgi:hypothetical protein